jgi:hypothetical protein
MKTSLIGSLSALALVVAACGEGGSTSRPVALPTPQAEAPEAEAPEAKAPETAPEAKAPDAKAPEAGAIEITSEADVALAFERLSQEGDKKGDKFAIVPAGVALFDQSITEWTAEWWKWTMSLPAAENPILTLDRDCSFGQDDAIFYLAGFVGAPSSERTCNVPFGQLALFPARTLINDYPCPDPAFEPAEGQSLQDFLTDGAKAAIDAPSNMKVTVDGKEIDTSRHRHTTALFNFTGDVSLQSTFDGCVTGTEQQGVSDGAWLVLAFAPGEHVVSTTATAPDGTQATRTVKVNVAKP